MSLKDIPERLSHAAGNAGSLWQMDLKAADLLDFVLIVCVPGKKMLCVNT